MSVLEAGDSFPNNVTFAYIPFEEENKDITACGIPTKFDASKGTSWFFFFLHKSELLYRRASFSAQERACLHERVSLESKLANPFLGIEFREKKVVLVAVPGAFTPTCQANHLPGFIENVDALRAKGVEQVVVIASNDPFVMSAWGKANYTKDDFIVSVFFLCTAPLWLVLFCLSTFYCPSWLFFFFFSASSLAVFFFFPFYFLGCFFFFSFLLPLWLDFFSPFYCPSSAVFFFFSPTGSSFCSEFWGLQNESLANRRGKKIFATDSELAFSKAIGWTQGDRTARYAIAVDHGEVIYAAKEVERGVSVSGADAVLAKL